VTIPCATAFDARAMTPARAEILEKDMVECNFEFCAQRDGDDFELGKNICRLQSMKKIFGSEKNEAQKIVKNVVKKTKVLMRNFKGIVSTLYIQSIR
jgi:hypothetical protein